MTRNRNPEARQRKREAEYAERRAINGLHRDIPPAAIKASARRQWEALPPDTRTPMQRWQGDPEPGRSALDRKRAAERQIFR